MAAGETSPLTPRDPKPATLPPPRRRRSRSTSLASTSTSTTSTSSTTSIRSTPSRSHCFVQTPFHCSSSSIPFSWEQTPGIPKMPSKAPKSHQTPRLPLPPPLRSDSLVHKKHHPAAAADVDPFVAALVECAKDPPAEPDPWIGSGSAAGAKSRRRSSIGDRFGFGLALGRLDLYGSCKESCEVAESTVEMPRVGRRVGSYRALNRRFG